MKKAGFSNFQTGGNVLRGLFQVREELVLQRHFRFLNCSLVMEGDTSFAGSFWQVLWQIFGGKPCSKDGMTDQYLGELELSNFPISISLVSPSICSVTGRWVLRIKSLCTFLWEQQRVSSFHPQVTLGNWRGGDSPRVMWVQQQDKKRKGKAGVEMLQRKSSGVVGAPGRCKVLV